MKRDIERHRTRGGSQVREIMGGRPADPASAGTRIPQPNSGHRFDALPDPAG